MSRGLRISRKVWVLLIVIAVIVGLVIVKGNSTILADDMSYRVVNQRTIVLTVGSADLSWTRVTGVTETETEVRITVETLVYPIPLPQSGLLPFHELTVSLSNNLGDKVVEDAQGASILPSR